MKEIHFKTIAIALLVMAMTTACGDDDRFGPSVIGAEGEVIDPASSTYEFDNWLYDEFVKPYNVAIAYKLKDVEADFSYNLVPIRLEQAKKLTLLIKYLWYDAYTTVAKDQVQFMKKNTPRFIQLIGSPAYNPISQTETGGTAESGIKITLYKCNELDENDVEKLNEYYFNTMHHEFAHILHQKIEYPVEFKTISKGDYMALGWEKESKEDAYRLGFVSPYGRSAEDEDFVEVISRYITRSEAEWDDMLDAAGEEGKAKIQKKLSICRQWLNFSWDLDLDKLRKEVHERQTRLNELFVEY